MEVINVELNEVMECPCLCKCGTWFDLHDGHASLNNTREVVCEECHIKEQKIMDIQNEIWELESTTPRGYNFKVKALKKKLLELGHEY
ncbi:MAG: hypothetical protein U0T69_11205 [Chitinophagales bacterium]